MTVRDDYLARIGALIRDARQHSGMTQAELAAELKTSQSAINRIEKGQQNLTLDMLARIGSALDSELVSVGTSGPSHLRVRGGTTLSGAIDVKSSKNAGVALLCASLLQRRHHDPAQGRPHRRGQPTARGADLDRRQGHLAQRGERPRSRIVPRRLTWPRWTPTPRVAPAASSCSSAR
ncbi:helix-turn-helix domain-containing protein [Aeromicrobium sp. UC242_57]|uniref:helix-turn-helix domain-containing protein n=1 Tax=Aeromicrobium sp. UC242_57 TaxID=3374624 RepID=UPI00378C260A